MHEKEIKIKWKETTIIKIENEKQKGQIKIIKVSEDDNKINGDVKGTPLKDVSRKSHLPQEGTGNRFLYFSCKSFIKVSLNRLRRRLKRKAGK